MLFQNSAGKLDRLGHCLVAQGGHRVRCTALRHNFTGAAFAASALGGNAKLELDFVKAHTGPRMAGNFTVGNSAANTDNHGGRQCGWLLKKV